MRAVLLLGMCGISFAINAAPGEGADDARKIIESARAQQCTAPTAEENTDLSIVTRVLEEKKPYAALAFIESFAIDSPRLDLLRAHGLRQTGSYEKARAIYQQLLGSCVVGEAYQGLGLVSSALGDDRAAAGYLRLAAGILPIDSKVRGDYGYALMRLQNYDAAFSEYLTAIELDGRNVRARNNLIYLLYLTDRTDQAEQFARKYGVDADEMEAIRKDVAVQRAGS